MFAVLAVTGIAAVGVLSFTNMRQSEAIAAEVLIGVKPALQAYKQGAVDIVQASLAGTLDENRKVVFDEAFATLEDRLASLSKLIESFSDASVQCQVEMFAHARRSLKIALLVSAALVALYGFVFVRTILRRLGAEPQVLRKFSMQIADGSLNGRFERVPPENSVAATMLRMQEMLSTAVKEIRAGAVSVATASQQLASVSANISQRTDTQASTLEETSPSMQELSSTIEQNSGSAHQANELATGGAVAVAGCNIVEQVVATMKGTRESSEKISEIIGLIAGIAF